MNALRKVSKSEQTLDFRHISLILLYSFPFQERLEKFGPRKRFVNCKEKLSYITFVSILSVLKWENAIS
ncbi:hypothetical protein RJT34_32677 [Clitoria ternatea]|uniref:Uncharacterized protein n=1 Tax=Clitoria ternatea TaxID=43366 RepID=A0AAN9I9R2_CLITE